MDFIYAARMHNLKTEELQKLIKGVFELGRELLKCMVEGPLSKSYYGNGTLEMWRAFIASSTTAWDLVDLCNAEPVTIHHALATKAMCLLTRGRYPDRCPPPLWLLGVLCLLGHVGPFRRRVPTVQTDLEHDHTSIVLWAEVVGG